MAGLRLLTMMAALQEGRKIAGLAFAVCSGCLALIELAAKHFSALQQHCWLLSAVDAVLLHVAAGVGKLP